MAQQYPVTRTQRETADRLGFNHRTGKAKTLVQDRIIALAQARREKCRIGAD